MKRKIYLVYECDIWLFNKTLVYICDDIERGITAISEYRNCSKNQAAQLREMMQSQCNNSYNEWLIEEVTINTFV